MGVWVFAYLVPAGYLVICLFAPPWIVFAVPLVISSFGHHWLFDYWLNWLFDYLVIRFPLVIGLLCDLRTWLFASPWLSAYFIILPLGCLVPLWLFGYLGIWLFGPHWLFGYLIICSHVVTRLFGPFWLFEYLLPLGYVII